MWLLALDWLADWSVRLCHITISNHSSNINNRNNSTSNRNSSTSNSLRAITSMGVVQDS
jgi:hypothetical protein